jgi:hypothetical protein
MRQKRLREARAELETCARDTCPRVARTDCRSWLADVVAEQPSIIIAPHEIRGAEVHDIQGVRVTIDGAIALQNADATSVTIDPGPHRLHLERAGAEALEQNIDIREGEKDRVVHVYWRAAEAIVPAARATPKAVYAAGALGVAALGAGTYFEIAGLSRRGDLNSKCQPTRACAQSDVDAARDLTRVGDVTIGAGLLLLAGALYLYVTRPIASPSLRNDHLTWVLGPTHRGWVAGLHARW